MSDKMSDKLLNCPFCGGEAEEQATVVKGVFMHEVVCKDCGFESKVQTAETPGEAREKAIAAWDQRKPMERILERLETMKGKPNELVYEFSLISSIIEIIKEEGLK